LGLTEKALLCTREEHDAFERSQEVLKRIDQLGNINPITDLPKIVNVVESIFGKDFTVERDPFGLRFAERVKMPADGLGPGTTATGGYTWTWGGDDSSADHDD
jgi:hypothetical protein